MTDQPVRVAVLVSGGGTNLQALLDALHDSPLARVTRVISNKADAGALERARTAGVPAIVLAHPDDARELHAALADAQLVVLAGYLKLVPPGVVARFKQRMINVHPALLPDFGGPGMYGRKVHAAVLASGARESGATVHFVDEHYDRGAIVAQWPVPAYVDDTPEALAARVLRVEHLVYPRVVDAVAAGRTSLANRAVNIDGGPVDVRPAFTLLPHEDSRLAENIELALGC